MRYSAGLDGRKETDMVLGHKKIEFEDDIVIVYADVDICDGKLIYKGLEDDEPMKRVAWTWEGLSRCYRFRDADGRHYKKICLDL